MESHRVNSIISGESPPLNCKSYINHHVGTPKQKQTSYYTIKLALEIRAIIVI